ncbi:MAG: hypothetical protein V4671_23780 [Armatimonadota bacterium]
MRQIIGDKMGPQLWASDERWYRGTPAHFLVMESPQYANVSVRTAERHFGPALLGPPQ